MRTVRLTIVLSRNEEAGRNRKKNGANANLLVEADDEQEQVGFVALEVAKPMPHIALPENFPGIRGALAFRPETAKPLNELVEVLLRGPSTLTPGERELIATYVSFLNDCHFCQSIHGAIAAAHLNGDEELVQRIKSDFKHANVSEKLKALLIIAGKVQRDGKLVTTADVEHARSLGATDFEIHDTVLIAAAFCMYNRYVDGLATTQPRDEALYRERGIMVARDGYIAVSKTYLPPEPVAK